MDDRLGPYRESLRDRYEFLRELGRGGMSIVWLARERQHDRLVAVKFLRVEIAQLVGDERFLREIQFAAELNHPHILPLLDSGLATPPGLVGLPFYSMPYIEGPTLEGRLRSEGQLALGDVAVITSQVAAALDHAHAHGVVHRDIKPGNVLFSGGIAVVADFGIARAVDRVAGDTDLTTTGLAIGTPPYMPPEQARGEGRIDGRADQYALGCVVYEMITGRPPYTDPTPNAVIARHLHDTPPPMTPARPDLPASVEPAVRRALAKVPADRYPSAGSFAAALREASAGSPPTAPFEAMDHPRRQRWRVAVVALAACALALVAWRILRPPPAPVADRHAVLTHVVGGDPALLATGLREAVERWEGASVVVPEYDPAEEAGFVRGAELPRRERKAGERERAERVVLGEMIPLGDSTRLRLSLWETPTGRRLAEVTATLPPGSGQVQEHRLRAMTDTLLRAQFPRANGCNPEVAPAPLPALRAHFRADSLLTAWALDSAAQGFRATAEAHPAFLPAALCQALVMSWSDPFNPSWQAEVLRLEGLSGLDARTAGLVEALRARSRGDMAGACAEWRALAGAQPADFVAQYGLADCVINDPLVVSDRTTRTGWRWRAELGEGRAAYRQASAQNPMVYRDLRVGVRTVGRRLFDVRPSVLRFGASRDGRQFTARPSIEGDTLAYVPVPSEATAAGQESLLPAAAAVRAAAGRILQAGSDLIATWRTQEPTSVDAMLALAESLEMGGDRTALDTLVQARLQAGNPVAAYRAAAAEVFLRARLGVSVDTAYLPRAISLADSLLGLRDAARGAPAEHAALAALRGRTNESAEAWASPSLATRLMLPLYLRDIAPRLLVHSAMAGPADSITKYAQLVERAVLRQFQGMDAEDQMVAWVGRAATYAWPVVVLERLQTLAGQGDPVVDAVAAVAHGDPAEVPQTLAAYWSYREALGSQAITLDAARTEAELWWAAGHPDRAARILDDTFEPLFGEGPSALNDPLQVAGLVRGMMLRARLQEAGGEPGTAARWKRMVRTFWPRTVSGTQGELP